MGTFSGASSQQHPAFSPNKLAMPSSVSIGSPAEFSKLLSSSTIVIADFYADWCGPCKTIAPTYESLAAKYSKPNKITFTKVNVDSQQEIAQKYGVRAMPTFMIFRSGSTINTIRGADVRGLTNAIEAAVKMAGAPAPRASLSRGFNFKGIIDAIIGFLGLYFISLFSFDAYVAAENSPFNIHKSGQGHVATSRGGKVEKRSGAATAIGKKLGTIADLADKD